MILYKKRIKVTPNQRRILTEAFAITETAVFNALAYRSNSPTAISIRNEALSLGGVETTETIITEN